MGRVAWPHRDFVDGDFVLTWVEKPDGVNDFDVVPAFSQFQKALRFQVRYRDCWWSIVRITRVGSW